MQETGLSPAVFSFSKPFAKFRKDPDGIRLLEEEILPEYLQRSRWFAGKAQTILSIHIESTAEIDPLSHAFLALTQVEYETGKPELYAIYIGFVTDKDLSENKKARIASLRCENQDGFILDALYIESFRSQLLAHIGKESRIESNLGSIVFEKGSLFKKLYSEDLHSHVLEADQSNSSVLYERKIFVKFFRKLFSETNPDLESIRFLSETSNFTHIPAYVGSFSFKPDHKPVITLAMFQQAIDSKMDAWTLFRTKLEEYVERLNKPEFSFSDAWEISPFDHLHSEELDPEIQEMIGAETIRLAELLAQRTAEMHAGFAHETQDPHFGIEPFTPEYRKFQSHHLEELLLKRIHLLNHNFEALNTQSRSLAEYFLRKVDAISTAFSKLSSKKYASQRIRIHGDYHLGQVLFDGSDFIILDFEGEPESSIQERRIRHSPLKDVAGMLRSFHYAVYANLYFSNQSNLDPDYLELAAENWYRQLSGIFLRSYSQHLEKCGLALGSKKDIISLTELHLLEKAVYEFGYELNGRPDWVIIPLKGIQQVLETI